MNDAFNEGLSNQSIVAGDRASPEAYLQSIADQLAKRYRGKKWFSFNSSGSYSGLGRASAPTGGNSNANQSQHNASIVLFSTSGPAKHFRDAVGLQAAGATGIQDGGTVSYSAPSGLNATQVASGGFTYSFDGMANLDRLQISSEAGNVIIDQIADSADGGTSTTSSTTPMSIAGTTISATVSNTGNAANAAVSMWNFSLVFYYLNPQPRVYLGKHTTLRQ